VRIALKTWSMNYDMESCPAFVTSSEGSFVELKRTDITGCHYRLTPVLNTQKATGRMKNNGGSTKKVAGTKTRHIS
jgi:BRCT domain type II-containing protein